MRERAYRTNNLGVALLEQFKYPEATDAFRQALQIDDSLTLARGNLSLALLYAQDLQGAVREAAEVARLLPSAPQPHYILGLVARAENRTADAVREFERVREIDPSDVGTNINLGQIYVQERQYAQAVDRLRRAVAEEPYNVTAAYNLGLALTRSGQTSEGEKMLQHAQTLRTTAYAVTYGSGYLEQGRYAEAVTSTGAAPELVDATVPSVAFAPAAIGQSPRAAAAVESPFGRRFALGDITDAGARAIAAGLGGGLTLIDADNDGHLDLFVASPGGQRLFRNSGGGTWTDATAASGLSGTSPNTIAIGCVAGDYDNDGLADLFVLRYGGNGLYHNDGNGRFSDVTVKAGVPRYPFLPSAAAWVDVDHDGDLDLVIAGLADLAATRRRTDRRLLAFPRDFAPAPLQLLRNTGNGTFADITDAARLRVSGHAVAIVPTDFDNRRDIDLLIVNHDAPPLLLRNLRNGTFGDIAAEVGLPAAVGSSDEVAAVAAADINKDDFPDFFFAGASGGVFALSDGRGRFTSAPAPDGARGAFAAGFVDYDNDGLLDLLTWAADGPRMLRNLGRRWSDVSGTATAVSDERPGTPTSARGLVLADLNGDSTTDFVTGGSGALAFWRNSGAGHRAQRVTIRGRFGNRLGVGSKVQVRSGSLSARLETSSATPAAAPHDLLFGLGARSAIDAVRVLWPSGTLQAETARGTGTMPWVIDELDRKPSSCPFLFAWNGQRFEFVTDFMGGGEMGYWEGPAVYNRPDPIEYVRIRADQLRPKDGRFQLRVTNELEEAVFLDRIELIAIAHPMDLEVLPNEGMTEPPKPFRLHGVRDLRVPLRAIDDHGHDLTAQIAHVDRRFPDDFALTSFRGYAARHTLTLDLGPPRGSMVLLLTGWTDYAFSSDNVAAHQAGLSAEPPSLEVKTATGAWRVAVAQVGIPVGRPQTIALDLSSLRPNEREVRLTTNMRVYWDQLLVGTSAATDGLALVSLDPREATLTARGFSLERRPDGRDPPTYDFEQVARQSPWKTLSGRYTREGDVLVLLTRADDMFVIARPGDAVALEFDASALGPLPAGWTRTFLLRADGFSKEMDINSASPDSVEPLPFHAMTAYPYRWPQHYPDTPEYLRYQAAYNTRVVTKILPSIDTVVVK
jgi:Tfp pilus assembly protein PilF